MKLDHNKSPGLDKVSVKMVKSIAHVICAHLADLFNSSLLQSKFPKTLVKLLQSLKKVINAT